MAWEVLHLTDPPMARPDVAPIQRAALDRFGSYAAPIGVRVNGFYDQATADFVREFQLRKNATGYQPALRTDGWADWATKRALGVLPSLPKAPSKRFVQQGVGFNTNAFLMGDVTHSYVNARDEGTAETLRLALPLVGVPKVFVSYSLGDDVMNRVLMAWPADRRDEIKLAVGFGPPSRPPGPTLLGNNPPGQGISGVFTPEWARPITYHFLAEQDMYGAAVGVLPQLYEILTRLETSIEFAVYLFQVLTSSFGPALLGLAKMAVPVVGAAAAGAAGGVVPGIGPVAVKAGFGALSGILGMVTPGPLSQTSGEVNLLAMITNIPDIVRTIVAALRFVQTNAHYHYHDQPRPEWHGLTAVDCAAQIIAEKVKTAVVYTIPGTVSWWNDGPPAWTAWKLP